MKKGKRIKPRFPVEYRLLIIPVLKDRERKTVTLVALRTVNEFTNFRYEIVVEPELSNHTLRLTIQGLRAPQVTIPGGGPAVFRTEYSDLNGSYTIVVSKLNRAESTFLVKISKGMVIVEKGPKKSFVEIVTNEEEW